ncbi:peptidase C39 family protein [Gryllotalpicola protaetiae]|uniref:Acetyltransferase n=1 Tax=Gryllotalpicola protaetiae TaxID=2419771 RepID=A0A387BJF0_9MICO|nr:peptidase C39 family protein [Gryllotalpicola protaetiae]AYG02284.1 acetyltransferase [Gryllotalpicola protaetiae]
MTTQVLDFDREALPDALLSLAAPAVLARWMATDRAFHRPRLVVVADENGTWRSAALVTARPHTAYLKIVDVVAAPRDIAEAVDAVVEHAESVGAVQLKWEGWSIDPARAAELGFVPLLPPLPSGDGTALPESGYVRWLGAPVADRVHEAPYYRQTTDFTCGAVAALSARLHAGATSADSFGRDAELAFWRGATNFPACEPVGLGVALQRAWPSRKVEIALDTDRPVVVDFHPEQEREWRAVLQRQSRAEAAALGVPISGTRLSMTDLIADLAAGDEVLLLMSLTLMQNDPTPHWILCHGLAGAPGAQVVVVEDPWVETPNGDSWVDAHLLPVAPRDLDAMSIMEASEGFDGYRGAVRASVEG